MKNSSWDILWEVTESLPAQCENLMQKEFRNNCEKLEKLQNIGWSHQLSIVSFYVLSSTNWKLSNFLSNMQKPQLSTRQWQVQLHAWAYLNALNWHTQEYRQAWALHTPAMQIPEASQTPIKPIVSSRLCIQDHINLFPSELDSSNLFSAEEEQINAPPWFLVYIKLHFSSLSLTKSSTRGSLPTGHFGQAYGKVWVCVVESGVGLLDWYSESFLQHSFDGPILCTGTENRSHSKQWILCLILMKNVQKLHTMWNNPKLCALWFKKGHQTSCDETKNLFKIRFPKKNSDKNWMLLTTQKDNKITFNSLPIFWQSQLLWWKELLLNVKSEQEQSATKAKKLNICQEMW